ncbi:ribokinase [Thalassobacillus sp. CUG 92003]|uniref:ribokinase n=1 Tax=Thalassobacillus sp. CUG 92003 TaxID=2736641 RepID=UPI0015E67AEF|nr:ribokinase [Thalassobacillus sp. CUG 92003]
MDITIVGSINIDIVALTNEYPKRGETIFGNDIKYLSGGKGANQAIACARLEKEVQMIGAVGRDEFGTNLIHNLHTNYVETHFVKQTDDAATGTALITIDGAAENTMLVLKGANNALHPADIRQAFARKDPGHILLVQMEVPEDTVIEAMVEAKKQGMYVILDPAPAEGITMRALKHADLIIPNYQEIKQMIGEEVNDVHSALQAAQALEAIGVEESIIKMADQGSLAYSKGKYKHISTVDVDPVDTVGAGDAFAGALACALADGKDLFSAAQFSSIAGALVVTKLGAQSAPTLSELKDFCNEHGFLLEEKV